jgi:hypothetical protein
LAKGRTSSTTKSVYRVYLRKAEDFYRLVPMAIQANNINGAGLAAIHSVISACDALTVFHTGVRSRGESHLEVTELLRVLDLEGMRERVNQIEGVLQLKNLVEYEDREISRTEALRLGTQAERILSWVRKQLPEV